MKHLIIYFFCSFIALHGAVAVQADDNKSRLINSGNGIIEDSKTGLMWQEGKSRKSFENEADAQQYAANLKLGGFSDWRLPTLDERWDLLQVFSYKINGTVEFVKYNSRYWTAKTDKGTTPIKLGITCMCRGDQEIEYKSKGYVRAVRP